MSGAALAEAALSLVGCPFRLHGRDPATGLDCLGVIHAALTATGRRAPLPTGYAMRGRIWPDMDRIAAQCGLAVAGPAVRAGDVLAFRPGPAQRHFAVAVGPARFVHAHAGLRRVVCQPAPPDWAIAGHWCTAED